MGKKNGRISSSEFADIMRNGGGSAGGSRTGSAFKGASSLRSDIIVSGQEHKGAMGKGKSLFNVDSQGQMLHPAHLNAAYKPGHKDPDAVAKSKREGRHKSNYAAVSAESAPALRQFVQTKKRSQV